MPGDANQFIHRPDGVTRLGNFSRVSGVIVGAIGIGLIVIGFVLMAKVPELTYIALVGAIVGLASIAMGSISLWMGCGLLQLRTSARISAIVVSILSLFVALAYGPILIGFRIAWLIPVLWLVVVILLVRYLLRSEVE